MHKPNHHICFQKRFNKTYLISFLQFDIIYGHIFCLKKEPTRRMTFGYHRSEVLGAFANVFILWILITILVSIAIKRIVYGNFTINPVAMLITASFGIIFNMVVFVILNTNLCFGGRLNLYFTNDAVIHSSSCKHHGHHANGSGFNIGLRAMVIHFIGDFIQSIGVLIAAIIIYYRVYLKLKFILHITSFKLSSIFLIDEVTFLCLFLKKF